MKLEVGLHLGSFLGFASLAIVLGLAQMVVVELLQEGLVTSLREHALFLKDGQDTHGLQVNNDICC